MQSPAPLPMPAMQGLIEVWSVLSDSDKDAVTEFFDRWTTLWSKWSGLMAPGQEAHFVARMNGELTEHVAALRYVYARQLADAAPS